MEINIDINEEEIEDIKLGSNGKPLPPKNDLIALIDADTLVFGSCLHCEYEEELLPRSMYTDDEWEDIISNDTYYEGCESIGHINLDEAYTYTLEKLQTILDNTGCQDYELHFTVGRTSFRYTTVWDQYKANRTEDPTKRAPSGLYDLKKIFAEKGKGFLHREWEADDIVVMKKKQWPKKYLLVALDKDVLYSLPGTHFNYYTSTQYNIPMKFFNVTEEEAMKHHYLQTLTGDSGDNVPGLHRVGKKTAEKILKHCTTKEECWKAVVKEYEKRGKDGIDAILSMRLVHMQQLEYNEALDKWEVKLWMP